MVMPGSLIPGYPANRKIPESDYGSPVSLPEAFVTGKNTVTSFTLVYG